ncbi:hypothetical protein NMG60_11004109 [Bertholletia excelsa]
MRGIVKFSCFVIFLQMVSWVGVSSRPLAPNDDHGAPQADKEHSLESLQLQVALSPKQGDEIGEVKKIGSSPPSCNHKCLGCEPCEAIQVPTTSAVVGVQYTNYEPEDWKCKCGPALYTP